MWKSFLANKIHHKRRSINRLSNATLGGVNFWLQSIPWESSWDLTTSFHRKTIYRPPTIHWPPTIHRLPTIHQLPTIHRLLTIHRLPTNYFIPILSILRIKFCTIVSIQKVQFVHFPPHKFQLKWSRFIQPSSIYIYVHTYVRPG
jgi:hypothetical protein